MAAFIPLRPAKRDTGAWTFAGAARLGVRRLDAALAQWEKGIAGFRARRVKAGSTRRAKDGRLASQSCASAGGSRSLYGHLRDLYEAVPIPELGASALALRNTPAPGRQVWLELAGLGGFLQPLPLGGPFTPGPSDAANPGERAAHGDVNRLERGRPHTGKAGM